MSNIQRFRHADPKRVRSFAVNSATVIEVGDMVYQEVDDVRPASDTTYLASLDLTQRSLRGKFVGIALTASASGETDPVQVAGRGTFEMDCAAGQFEIGDGVSADDNAGATALLDQTVIAAGANGTPIGIVARRYSADTTRVLVEFDTLLGMALAPMQIVHLGYFAGLGTADELVTSRTFPWPFKLVALQARVATLIGTGDEVFTVDKNTTALDDTITVPGASAIGVIVTQTISDATGDDFFDANDVMDVATAGGSDAGAVDLYAWVRPYLHES